MCYPFNYYASELAIKTLQKIQKISTEKTIQSVNVS
jgi:hypothetical protein